MRDYSFARYRSRFSRVDLLTAVVLLAAMVVAARPSSPLRARAETWRAERSVRRAVAANWDSLAAIATPLYAGDAEPDVIAFSDYECPFCRTTQPAVDSAVKAGMRVALIHLPLPNHSRARPAALVALCAATTGRFYQEHHFFLSTEAWRSDTTSTPHSGALSGPEEVELTRCTKDSGTLAALSAHMQLAERVGVMGTPTFASRNGVVRGARSLAELRALAAD